MDHAPTIYRLAVAIVGWDHAPDVLQDVLIRAWQDLPTLREPDRFAIWLRQIMLNRCRDVLRARRRSPAIALEPALVGLATIGDPAGAIAGTIDLSAAMSRLTIDQRTVVALHYGLGLPLREVARTLEIRDGTAKSRLNAALVVLRRALVEPTR